MNQGLRPADRTEPTISPTNGSNCFQPFRLHEVEQAISDRFEQEVLRHHDRIAVKSGDAEFSYGALNNAANVVARVVIKVAGTNHDPIGLLFDHRPSFVVASLASLKAGKVQVPLEARFPVARLQHMLHQSGAAVVLTDSQHFSLARAFNVPRIINIDKCDLLRPEPDLGLHLRPNDAVAIVYTSGSTGQPKGIVWNHRAVLHAVMRHTNTYRIGANDRVVGLAVSPRPYLYCLLNGAAYYPVAFHDEDPDRLAEWMTRQHITVFRAAASAFRAFARSVPSVHEFPHLRLVLLFGEPVHYSDAQLCRRSFGPHCMLAASLGCREFDDYAWSILDSDDARCVDHTLPGFQMIDGADVLVVDGQNQTLAVGEVGEIVLRSRHHPLGYWRRPDLTQAAFQPDRYDPTISLYRTGDLGFMSSDGRLFHTGRKDVQVKVRGHLVAPAEVEGALLRLEGIKEAAVVGRDAPDNDTRLVAYVVPEGPRAPAVTQIRRALAEMLPDYMIPSWFVFLDALPLTPTDKIDRRALPLPDGKRPMLETPFVAPATPLEHQLQQIWQDTLGVRPIGVTDDFFGLGGHSLLAAQLALAIETATGRRLPLSTLLEGTTIQHLATVVSRDSGSSRSPTTALHRNGAKRPFFFLHGDLEGGGLYCRTLALALGPDQPFVAVHPHGVEGGDVPDTIEAMAIEHLGTLRAIQPHGPYQLGGFCSGGVIAFEIARRLKALGENVVFLGLLDVSAENAFAGSRVLRLVVNTFDCIRGLTAQDRLVHYASVRDHIGAWHRWASERARYYRCRIPQLPQLGPSDWAVLFRRKAERLRDRLDSAFRRRRKNETRLDVPTTSSSQLDRFSAIRSIYRLAMAQYVPGRYEGTITVFRSETYFGRSDLGWRTVAPKVEVHRIPSDYSTAITRHVQLLGERLGACLQNIHS